ncbi:MAG: peptidylprolyl isomerase [Gemmatimonadaceae bacterium]
MIVALISAAVLFGTGLGIVKPDVAPPVPHHARAVLPTREDSLDVALYARILKSADQRILDSTLLDEAMQSRDVEMRRVAARTLSQVALRDRAAALPMLRALVRDHDATVAGTALFGLGLVRDTSSVPLLTSIVRVGGAPATSAAWALGEIGKPAIDSISELLGEPAMSRRARESVTRELLIAASKVRPLAFDAVKPYLASHLSELRWAAAYGVARQRYGPGVSALLNARAPDAKFRAELARVLAKNIAGDSLSERALARLHTLVVDADPYVRINALQAIGSYGLTARSAILRGLHDRDANVRVSAAGASALPFDTAMTEWLTAWRVDTSYKVRKSLIEAASSRGVRLPGTAEWRGAPDWRMRAAALQSWAKSHDTATARDMELASAHDTDSRVRITALHMLAARDTAHRDSVIQRVLEAARSDPDSMVRNAVRGSRVRTLDTLAVERPLDWYESVVRRVVIPSLHQHPPRAIMRTIRGDIGITFDGVLAPLTVLNFATLADAHYYDHVRFHRVVPGFVAQDGDPRGDGEGGPGYSIRDELTLLPYRRGAVGMALSGPDTGGSQYFLTLTPQPHLTGHYTVFGSISSGLAAMDSLVEGDTINSIRIIW